MSKVFNMVSGGGKNISAIVISGLKSTDSVTCSGGGKPYSATWDATAKHWEIVGLPLGTFTVTATNGVKTITETVLIDITGVYEIVLSFKTYLYNEGDECVAITGGLNLSAMATTSFSKLADSLQMSYVKSISYGLAAYIDTLNQIDFTNCNALYIKITNNNSTVKYRLYIDSVPGNFINVQLGEKVITSFDISAYTGKHSLKIEFASNGNQNPFTNNIYAIWLE